MVREYKIVEVYRDYNPFVVYQRSKFLWLFWGWWSSYTSCSTYDRALEIVQQLTDPTPEEVELYRARTIK